MRVPRSKLLGNWPARDSTDEMKQKRIIVETVFTSGQDKDT